MVPLHPFKQQPKPASGMPFMPRSLPQDGRHLPPDTLNEGEGPHPQSPSAPHIKLLGQAPVPLQPPQMFQVHWPEHKRSCVPQSAHDWVSDFPGLQTPSPPHPPNPPQWHWFVHVRILLPQSPQLFVSV